MNFISSIIENCLKKYIVNFNSKSFNIDILSGKFSITDIHLNCNEINNLIKIPSGLQINQAYCSHINLHIENISDISELKIHIDIGTLKLYIVNSKNRHFNIIENQISIPKIFLENVIVRIDKILILLKILNSDTLVLSLKKLTITNNKCNNNFISKKFDIEETSIYFFDGNDQIILIHSNPIISYIDCIYNENILNTINMKLTLYNPLEMPWNNSVWTSISKFCLNLRHSINIEDNSLKTIFNYWNSINVSFLLQITIKKWYLSMVEENVKNEYIFKGDNFNMLIKSKTRNDMSFNMILDNLIVQCKTENELIDLIINTNNRVFEYSFNMYGNLISSSLLIDGLDITINRHTWEKINRYIHDVQPYNLTYFHEANVEIQKDIYQSLFYLKTILNTNNLLLGFIENLTCIVVFKDININFKTNENQNSFTILFPHTSLTNKPQWITLPLMKNKRKYNKDFPFELSIQDISILYNKKENLFQKTSLTLFGIYSEEEKKCLDLTISIPLIQINFKKEYLKLLKNIIVDLENWNNANENDNRDHIEAIMSLIDENNSLLDIIYDCEKGNIFNACIKFLNTYILQILMNIGKIDMTFSSSDTTNTHIFFEPLQIKMSISPLVQKLKMSIKELNINDFYMKKFPFHINIERLNSTKIKNFKIILDRQTDFIEELKELTASLYLTGINISIREKDSIEDYKNSIYTYIVHIMKKNFQRLSNKKEAEIIAWIDYLSNFLVWEFNLIDCILRISKMSSDGKIHNINTIRTFNQNDELHSKDKKIRDLENQLIALKAKINNKTLLFE